MLRKCHSFYEVLRDEKWQQKRAVLGSWYFNLHHQKYYSQICHNKVMYAML